MQKKKIEKNGGRYEEALMKQKGKRKRGGVGGGGTNRTKL